MQNSVSEPQKKPPFWRRIPGFRSGKPWKMVVASVIYLCGLLIIFGVLRLRAQKAEQVACSLHAFGAFAADQGAIWAEVERKQREMGARSPTGAVNEVYESHEEKLQRYCAAFSPLAGQVGAAVFINGSFVCLDAFDSPVTLRKLYARMIESYALDALEQAGRNGKEPEKGAAERLLVRIATAQVSRYPSVGLGEDLRIKARGLLGSCLVLEGRVIHLAAFAGAEAGRKSVPLSRPSRRRRAHL